jgi:hypothetical protein
MTTTKRKSPPLPQLLAELRASAARTRDDRSLVLSHGARVAWRVRDGRVVFAVSRKGVRVGDRELIIFKAAAGVPAEAVRLPADGQMPVEVEGACWWRVCWRWEASDAE